MFAPMTTEEIFAEDWSAYSLTDEVKEMGRIYAADARKRLQRHDPEVSRHFSKKMILAAGMVFAQMFYHRKHFDLPVDTPIHPEIFMAITLAQPEFKNLKRDKFCREFDELAGLLGLWGTV